MIARALQKALGNSSLKFIQSRNIVLQQQCFHSSVDSSEMKHFSQIKDWWKSGSEMAPLYSYNFARVNFIKQFMKDFNNKDYHLKLPLNNLQILDVGCGGGLLSESLCRLGANVTGLDANENSILIANNHKKLDQFLEERLNYKQGTAGNINQIIYSYFKFLFIEELCSQNKKYDLVTCMEVIEHIQDKQQFIATLSQLVRPGGMIFVSTMEKTRESYLKLILGAEHIAKLVPKGTHDWNKFINSEDLSALLEDNGFKVLQIQGYSYDIINNQMEKSNNKMNYLISAIKLR
ncbi:hypothetical protein ABPG72_014453 [Tetrahymena utriculariae]